MLQTSTPFDSTIPHPGPIPESAPARLTCAGAGALAQGTILGEFEIVRLLGSGGFGIVYLAHDRLLLRQVAIKEYMPATLARRRDGQTVVVHHRSAAKSFAAGLTSFLNEAQLLARFDHPALVKVYRFWQANNTAYMAMPYYAGRTLKDERMAMRATPQEAWLRTLAEPLLNALELLHGQGIYHRDISPDNIMIRPDGRPVLLDFGSARHAIGDGTGMLTVLLKPNFAPIEQYGDGTSMRQGPWTDVYALGATLRFAYTGKAPTPSVVRAVGDDLAPLASDPLTPQGTLSLPFLAAIDWALTLAPEGRPQDIASLRRALRGEAPKSAQSAASDQVPKRAPRRPGIIASVAALFALALATGVGWIAWRDRAVASMGGAPLDTTAAVAQPASVLLSKYPSTTAPVTSRASAVAPVAATQPMTALPRVDLTVPPSHLYGSESGWTSKSGTSTTATAAAPRHPARKSRGEAPATATVSATKNDASVARTTAPARAFSPTNASLLESCAKLDFFARQMCVVSQCARPELHANPQCAERRRANDERLRRM